MSAPDRLKYRVIVKAKEELFEEEINHLATEGYGLAFYQESPDWTSGIMKLKEETVKLEDAVDVINVDITSQQGGEIAKKLSEG